jgi:hypothetical protein
MFLASRCPAEGVGEESTAQRIASRGLNLKWNNAAFDRNRIFAVARGVRRMAEVNTSWRSAGDDRKCEARGTTERLGGGVGDALGGRE